MNKETYEYLLSLKSRNKIIIYMLLILLIFFLIFIHIRETYDTLNIYGIYDQDLIVLEVPLDNSDKIINSSYIIVNKEKYDFSLKSISEIKEKNFVNYQTYYLDVDNSFQNNQVLLITFYYNKQKIVQKIYEAIF